MDYKEKYENALERARNIRFGNPSSATANVVCEYIFPELKVSEDEKIKKAIHIYLDWLDGKNKDYQPKGEYTIRDMLAWLEKQGDYNILVEEIKERKELISKEKKKATNTNDKLSLGGRLEELLAFTKEKQRE